MANRTARRKRTNSGSKASARFDGLTELMTGRGTSRDKLEGLNPLVRKMAAQEMRLWYMANGFIQNIVDAPAEDATREWITIRTNRDEDNPESGLKGLNISRLIQNRLTALGLRAKIKDLIRFSRMYREGAFLYFGIDAAVPQTQLVLSNTLPTEFNRIEFINVFGPDRVSIRDDSTNPLSKVYHRLKYSISGIDVHESRLCHLVHGYLTEEKTGMSVVETILDAVKAQDTALWSVTSILFEMALWVFKSPAVQDMGPEKVAALLANMRAVISTQSSMAISDDESMERIQSDITGLKEIFDFVFENLACLARIPKSRLMGQSQGVITAGQYDLLAYYDSVAKFQEIEVRPVIEKAIDLVVHERSGKIWEALDGNADKLDWEFEFNPLWRLGPVEQAEVDLKGAQESQIYIATGVLGPTEVRSRKFKDLEEFHKWEGQSLNMKQPAQPQLNASTAVVPGTPDVEAESKAKLKGSVGGVQGILNIQQSVSSGATDYESAINILVLIYGLSDEDARKILGTPEKKPEVIADNAQNASGALKGLFSRLFGRG